MDKPIRTCVNEEECNRSRGSGTDYCCIHCARGCGHTRFCNKRNGKDA